MCVRAYNNPSLEIVQGSASPDDASRICFQREAGQLGFKEQDKYDRLVGCASQTSQPVLAK